MDLKTAKKYLSKNNCLQVGRLQKTHGIKGQIIADNYIDFQDFTYIFLEFDGFLVPFFIEPENSKFHLDPIILKLKNINTINEAKQLVNTNIFLPLEEIIKKSPEIYKLDFAIGFQIITETKTLGKVINFYDLKKNPILEIQTEQNEQILLPINVIEEYEFDVSSKKLYVKIDKNYKV